MKHLYQGEGDKIQKMEIFQEISGILLKPETMVTSVICPALLTICKWIWNLFAGYIILVPRYQEKRVDRYMYVWVLKLWKITIIPAGFYVALYVCLYLDTNEIEVKELVKAVSAVLLCLFCIWMLLYILDKKRLGVILKLVVAILIDNMK